MTPKVDFTTDKLGCFLKPGGVQFTAKPDPPAGNSFTYTYAWTVWSDIDPYKYSTLVGSVTKFDPYHVGTFNVKLVVSNGHCSDSTTKNNIFEVLGDTTSFTAFPLTGCMDPDFISDIAIGQESIDPNDPNNKPVYHWRVDPEYASEVTFLDPFAKKTKVIITNHGCYDIILDIITHLGNDTCVEEIVYHSYICAGINISYQVQPLKCPGDTITVINNSDAGDIAFKWSVTPKGLADIFPNDTSRDVKIVFKTDTCYNVQLVGKQTINGISCADTSFANHLCVPSLQSDFFTTTPSFYCAPEIGKFYDTIKNKDSSLNPIKYLWNFGDGDSLLTTKDSVAHVYLILNKESYDIRLTVYYASGCSKTIIKKDLIKVVGPLPGFSVDKNSGCDSMTVNFKNTSKNIKSFYFFYGDGSPVISTNPTVHKYSIQDPALDSVIYYPLILETDDTVCKAYHQEPIKIYRTPTDAKITHDLTGGCVPASIQFHAVARAANSWKWDFDGDGIIDDSTHKDPVFIYKKPGNYKVKLITGFMGNCQQTVYSDGITITQNAVAGFIPSSNHYCGNEQINFKPINKNTSKYIFDYGDGSLPDSGLVLSHTYTFKPSNDTIDSVRVFPKMIAIKGVGCADTFSLALTGYKAPVAGFTTSVVSGCSPLKVHFTDTSINGFGAEWDFDNDGIVDAYGKEIDWIFKPGIFTVKLRSFTTYGCSDSSIKVHLIEVNDPPKANFTVSDSVICFKNPVQFFNTTQPSAKVKQWYWTIDDSLSYERHSSQQDPVFRFYTPGWHTVSLVAIDDQGCVGSIAKRAVFVDDTLPPANSALSYVTVKDTNSITISWEKSANPLFKEYVLNRVENGIPVKVFQTFNISDTIFTESNPKINTSGNSYCYNLQITNACGRVSSAGSSHCTILLNETALAGPVNVLNWNAYVGWQPLQYQIFRTGANGNINRIDTVDGNTLTYTDTALCDETYCYFVEAIKDIGGLISKSNTTCLHPDYNRINYPLYLEYVTDLTDGRILVQWDTTGNKNLVSYIIDRYDPYRGWWYNYTSTKSNVFFDNKVDINNNHYTYRVKATDKCGYSNPLSNIGTSILLEQKVANDNIALSWNRYGNWNTGVQYYKLQLQQKDHSYKTIATQTDTTYLDNTVYPNIDTAYCYRVIAYQSAPGHDSSVSNRACAVLPSRVFVPNAFSPLNQDSLNDVWKVSTLSVYNAVGNKIKSFSAKVFNRWGTLVFESDDLNRGWDGKFRGKALPLDVYLYMIDAEGIDGREIHLKGNLTIVN